MSALYHIQSTYILKECVVYLYIYNITTVQYSQFKQYVHTVHICTPICPWPQTLLAYITIHIAWTCMDLPPHSGPRFPALLDGFPQLGHRRSCETAHRRSSRVLCAVRHDSPIQQQSLDSDGRNLHSIWSITTNGASCTWSRKKETSHAENPMTTRSRL